MLAPEVRELPPAPRPIDEPSVFNSKAFALVDALANWTGDINALVDWLNANIVNIIRTVTADSYYLSTDHQTEYLRFTNASAKTATAGPISNTFAGSYWNFRNANTGNLTIVEGEDVTINPPAGGTLVVPPNGTVTLVFIADGVYDLMGQVVAA